MCCLCALLTDKLDQINSLVARLALSRISITSNGISLISGASKSPEERASARVSRQPQHKGDESLDNKDCLLLGYLKLAVAVTSSRCNIMLARNLSLQLEPFGAWKLSGPMLAVSLAWSATERANAKVRIKRSKNCCSLFTYTLERASKQAIRSLASRLYLARLASSLSLALSLHLAHKR